MFRIGKQVLTSTLQDSTIMHNYLNFYLIRNMGK